MVIRNHRDLLVWQQSIELVVELYRLTNIFPKEEKYGLRSQLRRAACSVPMNIAEGHGRGTRKDYAHFVSVAKGSLMEVETGLHIACRLEYLRKSEISATLGKVSEIERMLSRLRSKLVAVSHGGPE